TQAAPLDEARRVPSQGTDSDSWRSWPVQGSYDRRSESTSPPARVPWRGARRQARSRHGYPGRDLLASIERWRRHLAWLTWPTGNRAPDAPLVVTALVHVSDHAQ